jgi:hypothetical protein
MTRSETQGHPEGPAEPDGQWLRDLRGPNHGTPAHKPASHPPLVAEVLAELGEGPVAWAVDLGHQMATRIIAEIPALGGGEESFQTLRMGTESATLRSMLLLVSNDPGRIGVTEEALEGDRDFVRRGVSLDQVLRGIRLGHSLMAHGFLEAAAAFVEEPLRAAEMKRTSDLLFEYIDDFASSMASEYLTERDRWVTSAAAEREELVHSILDQQPVSATNASTVLSYPLERYHVALVLWQEANAGRSPTDLQRAASRILKASRCGATLMVLHGASSLWVWGSWRSQELATADFSAHVTADIHVAAGSLTRGVDGFRQSHLEAMQTANLVRSSPVNSAASLTHYADVELVVLLTQNTELARNFMNRELGPLAEPTPSAAELRETVAAYLTFDRSLVKAAEHLHVARNTVAYRVKKFENLVGRDLKDRRLELEVALRLAAAPGARLLQQP